MIIQSWGRAFVHEKISQAAGRVRLLLTNRPGYDLWNASFASDAPPETRDWITAASEDGKL